jgi:alpha-tubulin suppressor-like RCC1 family protein
VKGLWNEEDPASQKKIDSVYAAGHYNIVLEKPADSVTNQLYSWGMGSSYVLGNREEDNQYEPYTVHPKMFEELPVLMVGCGT